MGVHCINPKSKDFINISKRLNISPANLEDIIHKYLYENDTDEYPSDDYIKAALEGTRTEMFQSQVDLWEKYYLKPKRFKTLLELNRAKLTALKFFKKEAISEYIDAEDNYVLKVAKPINKNYEKELLDILAKAPRDSEGRLLAPNGKPSNLTERQYALVRSKAFKKWFGDWEKAFIIPMSFMPKKGWVVGKIIDNPIDAANICDNTQIKVLNSIIKQFGKPNNKGKFYAKPVTIWAKSPINNKQIHHSTVAVRINGKIYLYDMPQSEYIKYNSENNGTVIKEYSPRLIEYTEENLKTLYGTADENIHLNDESILDSDIIELPLTNASKVVDENGEPRVMYHGSPDLFDTFSYDFFGRTDPGDNGRGFYFAYRKETAKGYGDNIYSVFLNVKHPFIHIGFDTQSKVKGFNRTYNPTNREMLQKRIDSISRKIELDKEALEEYKEDEFHISILNKRISYNQTLLNSLQQELSTKPKDYLDSKLYDTLDEYDGVMEQDEHYQIVVRNPNQIKSATDNTGAFSTTNDRIDRFGEGKKSDIINKLLDRITDGTNYYTQDDINYLHSRNLVINQAFTGNNIKEVLESFKSSIRKIINKYSLENHYDLGIATLRRLKLEGNLSDKDSYYNFIQLLQNIIIDKLQKSGKTIEVKPDNNFTAAMGARVNGNTISLVYNPRLLLMDNERLDYILAHELVHTVTSNSINNVTSNTATEAEQLFYNDIWNIIVDLNDNKNFYWDFGYDVFDATLRGSHIKEFIANVMTNPELQRHLAQIKIDKKLSLWSRFINAIKSLLNKYLGINISDSYLEKLVNTISLHIEKLSLSLQNYGYDAMTEGEKVSDKNLQQEEIDPLKISDKTLAFGVTIDSNLIRNYRNWLLNNPNGIVAYRVNRLTFNTPLMVEQGIIGNPFDWLKYGTEVCLKMFYNWLVNGNNYNEPLATEEFRQAIIDKLLNTLIPNILYYKELNMPSHATILGYLINNKLLLNKTLPTQKTLQLLGGERKGVTKIISGGQTGVDTIGLQVAKELGLETGGTAPKNFLREYGIDLEDISSYGLTEITDELQAEYTNKTGKRDPYTGRTELNVRNSDGTVYFYTDEDKSGMIATQRAANEFNKPFLVNPTAEELRQWIKDNNIQTLNVAGNRGSKLAEDNKVAKILREALREKPEQKQLLRERDPFEERLREINRLLDTLQESSLMTNTEIREIAEQVVYWISDHITELQQNPELAVKIYGDSVKNLDTQTASRIEIVNAIGLDNIKEMCKLKFSPKNAGYTKISTIRKANLIIDNWDAIMLLASDVFTEIEKFSITETVVADKVVSLTNENLNNNLDNFNAEELNDEESILETHGNLLEHWQTKANTIDIMDSMSLLMHRAIAQCYQLKEVSRDENNKPVYDKVKSEFGINLRVKPREVTGSLLRWCQGCLNIKDVIANLKAKESANPWISLIITKLEDNSGNESDFLSQFFGVFVKPFMSYSIVKIDEDGNYISQVVNKNPALKEAVKGITTLYKIGEHPMFKSNGAVNKETFKLFSEAMKELANLDLEKNKDKIAHNLGFMYNALGFSITNDLVSQILDEDTYKMLTTQFGYIHKSLYDNLNIANSKDYEPLKFKGKGSFLGTLNKILKPITDTLEDTAVSAFYDNGNMYQSYVIPSYMTKLMSKFHLDGEKFDLFITNEYGKYDWFKERNSRDIERGWKLPILRELVTNPKAREVFDHKVQLTFNKHQYMKKMDDTEVTLAILAEYWAETTRSTLESNRIPAWFRVPMLSNKPSAEYIKFYSERGINYLDVITDNVYKIFLQEMSRILTVMMRNYGKQDPEFIKNFDKNGKKFNFVDFMNEYLTGDSKNSLLGKLILSKLNGLKLSPYEELTFSNLAKKAINDALTEKAESIVNNFERKGIFEGAKKIEGIDKDNIREELINFAWNDTYMSMNILQLTITDIAYYKDAEDLQKRLAQIHAPGIRANQYATDYQGNPVSDGKLRTIYLKDFDNFISNIIDNVSVVFDRKIKNARTEEEKLGYRVLKESIVELFKNINVADAQGYSSPTSYRKKALLFGKWSKGAEDIYRKLISGEYTYSDLKTAFLPLKPFVYTLIEKSSNVNSDEAPMTNLKVGVLNKNSEYLLIMADALLLGEDTGKPNLLRALYSVMEESSIDVKETTLNNGKKQRIRTPRIDGLDTVLFESTVKAGLRGAIDINQFAYDEDGERKAKEYIESLIGKNRAYNETYVDEIPVEDYCLLQEIPAHFRGHELAHGSLIRAITPSDLESTDALGNPITYNVEGKEFTAELFKTEYEKTIAANIEDSIETLTKELNLSPEATLVDKNRALEKILRREILSSPRYGVDLLLACTLNEEGLFRIPKGDPIQSKRIELLLNSIIKNRINKQEIAGGPVVQVSNFGTSRELNIKFKAKGGGLLMTRKEFEKSPLAKKVTATSLTDKFNARYGKTSKTMTYELYIEENQAGIAYFEVFAPIYLNDIFEKFQNPDGSIDMKAIEELNPDLLKMIGYRIPTEDKYSCAPLKIVGFLPREAGDTIMLPNDITLLTGSDFKQYWSH